MQADVGTKVCVRPVERRDAEQWLSLRCALWPEASVETHRQDIEAFLAGTAEEPQGVLVAEDGRRIVGFVELSIRAYAEGCSTNRVAYLEGWYVAPEFQRRGYGRALIAAAERWGIDRGCTEFASDTPLDNDLSKSAHEACGFVEVAVVRCFMKQLSN
jgi:aminoglycoside 6'-N-acetyltransferase I